MSRLSLSVASVTIALALTTHSHSVRAAGDLDAAFRAFWNAANADAAAKTVHGILDTGADFDAVVAKLKAGRPYAKEKTGVIRTSASVGGISMENLIEIPAEYDPAKT